MRKERGEQPNILEILDNELRRGSNDPSEPMTVNGLAEKMGIDMFTLADWMQNDKQFREDLFKVKEAFDQDPLGLKDKPDDEYKLDAITLSFGIQIVLEETKKRYTV